MLKDRDLDILCAVVGTFLRDGHPVGSARLKERLGLPLSTATIRNVMARLEGGGYLAKPHTSAGRVPTDEGYRVYVDQLDDNQAVGEAFVSAFRDEIREQDVGVSAVMACASRILGALSRNFAMVYGSFVRERLVDLGGSRLLIVVRLSPEFERTSVLKLDRDFVPEVISRAQHWINTTVNGLSLEDAKAALDSAVRDNVTDEGIIAREVAARREDIFSDPPAIELYFENREHLPAEPEMGDPRFLHVLLRILGDKEYLTSLLSERIGEDVRVTIGREHGDEGLHPFSLVTAGYRLGTARGVLGVIGPTRMHYALVRSLVRSAARELGTFGERYL
jgi:heat-inducible transcriptional repressor